MRSPTASLFSFTALPNWSTSAVSASATFTGFGAAGKAPHGLHVLAVVVGRMVLFRSGRSGLGSGLGGRRIV